MCGGGDGGGVGGGGGGDGGGGGGEGGGVGAGGTAVMATFCPIRQWLSIWHARYSVPAAITTASNRLGVLSEPPPPWLVEASSVAPLKSQPVYAASDAIR